MARIILELEVPDLRVESVLAWFRNNSPTDVKQVHVCTYAKPISHSIVEGWREGSLAMSEIVEAQIKRG